MGDRALTSRRSVGLALDSRGSIYIEMIFFLPVAVLLWMLLNFVYESKKTAVHAQRDARECAWQYAMNGCRGGLPSPCTGSGASTVADAELRAAGGGSFERVAQNVPPTAINLVNLHGRRFDVKTERVLERPAVLGGSTTAEGRFAVVCGDDPPRRWRTAELFGVICRLNSRWCP